MSSSFKLSRFLATSFTVHFWIDGSTLTPLPAESILTKVLDTPYPTPLLWILTETILPEEFNSGVNLASEPIPNTTKSGGEL